MLLIFFPGRFSREWLIFHAPFVVNDICVRWLSCQKKPNSLSFDACHETQNTIFLRVFQATPARKGRFSSTLVKNSHCLFVIYRPLEVDKLLLISSFSLPDSPHLSLSDSLFSFPWGTLVALLNPGSLFTYIYDAFFIKEAAIFLIQPP